MIRVEDFIHGVSDDGDSIPSFTRVLAEDRNKKLTAEVYLRESFPAVLFCIYLNGEGEYAGNTLDEAIDEYNSLAQN